MTKNKSNRGWRIRQFADSDEYRRWIKQPYIQHKMRRTKCEKKIRKILPTIWVIYGFNFYVDGRTNRHNRRTDAFTRSIKSLFWVLKVAGYESAGRLCRTRILTPASPCFITLDTVTLQNTCLTKYILIVSDTTRNAQISVTCQTTDTSCRLYIILFTAPFDECIVKLASPVSLECIRSYWLLSILIICLTIRVSFPPATSHAVITAIEKC